MSMGVETASASDIAVANQDGVTIYYNYIYGSKLAVTYRYGYSADYSGTVVIPDEVTYNNNTYSVTSIGATAFAQLATNPDVYSHAKTPPAAAADAFNYSTARGTLHVPYGCVDAYRNAEGWSAFKTIVEMEAVDEMGEPEWYLITDNNEQFKMSTVSMLVAADDSQYFSVLDLQGNVLAEDVLRVHFLKMDPASVKNIMVDEPQNMLKRYVNNQLTLVGARGTVNIYSVSGVKVASTHAMGQETIIDVSALPSGTYILQCGKLSFKFNKK